MSYEQEKLFFIGHREASGELLPIIQAAVERHIVSYGVTEFIVGHYGGFDRLAAKAVISAKQEYPEVTLSLLLPYHPEGRPINIPEGIDNTYYPPGMETVPRKLAIIRANRYTVDHVDYLIAYARHTASSARELVDYARRREARGLITVHNLAENSALQNIRPIPCCASRADVLKSQQDILSISTSKGDENSGKNRIL